METADHLAIPLLDGTHALAQIARVEDDRLLLYITRSRTSPDAKTKPLIDPHIIAVFCALTANVPSHLWPVIGYEPVPRIAKFKDMPLVLLDVQDSALIEAFANAVHGLYPWDGFPDVELFTNMLRNPNVLPNRARMSANFPKPEEPDRP